MAHTASSNLKFNSKKLKIGGTQKWKNNKGQVHENLAHKIFESTLLAYLKISLGSHLCS